MESIKKIHKKCTYKKFLKRGFDIICSGLTIICLSWLYFIVAVLVRIKLGSPVIFTQMRPGLIEPSTGKERIFKMYKFRSMTNERDENGELMPDNIRLNSFGKWLRSTSLDELPEIFNILKGDMSVVGPRPQLVRDMVFMTDEQRRRHSVRPGLTGLAQCNGRNNMAWEKKFEYDLEYIDSGITFWGDVKIILMTVLKVLKQDGITEEGMETAMDFGDYLLKIGSVDRMYYDAKQIEANELIRVKR